MVTSWTIDKKMSELLERMEGAECTWFVCVLGRFHITSWSWVMFTLLGDWSIPALSLTLTLFTAAMTGTLATPATSVWLEVRKTGSLLFVKWGRRTCINTRWCFFSLAFPVSYGFCAFMWAVFRVVVTILQTREFFVYYARTEGNSDSRWCFLCFLFSDSLVFFFGVRVFYWGNFLESSPFFSLKHTAAFCSLCEHRQQK